MLSQQDQQVTVRGLPAGNYHDAYFRELNGRLLSLELSSVNGGIQLKPGDLVEVISPSTLYLGQIRTCQERTMIVGVEHSLDRETLALIQRVWHGPGS